VHPTTGETLQRVHFLQRSHEIGSDGTIVWHPPGVGINPDDITLPAHQDHGLRHPLDPEEAARAVGAAPDEGEADGVTPCKDLWLMARALFCRLVGLIKRTAGTGRERHVQRRPMRKRLCPCHTFCPTSGLVQGGSNFESPLPSASAWPFTRKSGSGGAPLRQGQSNSIAQYQSAGFSGEFRNSSRPYLRP
jgi:hypothetical protein